MNYQQWIEDQLKWHKEWKPTYGDNEIDIAKNNAKIEILEELLSYIKHCTE